MITSEQTQAVLLHWPITRVLGFMLFPSIALSIVLYGNYIWSMVPWWIFIPALGGIGYISYYMWLLFYAGVMGLGMVVTGNWPKFWGIMKGK